MNNSKIRLKYIVIFFSIFSFYLKPADRSLRNIVDISTYEIILSLEKNREEIESNKAKTSSFLSFSTRKKDPADPFFSIIRTKKTES